jgi:hypothetical protein
VKCRKTDFLAQLAEHRIPDPKARVVSYYS